MEFDNERGRHEHGFDAGQIIDGTVRRDPDTGRMILVDDEGVGFDPQAALETLEGQMVRFTMISHRSIQRATELLKNAEEDASAVHGDG